MAAAESSSGAARHGGARPVSGAGRSGLCPGHGLGARGSGLGARGGGMEGLSGEELVVLPARTQRRGVRCGAVRCGASEWCL